MIISKYVVGDVVIVDGKQQVVFIVSLGFSHALHERSGTMYKLNDGMWYHEEALDVNSIN